jgi:nucleotide-binding universal stress UspA family protein
VEYNTNKNLAQQICDIAKARNAFSVIVGSRPLSGQQRFFLGSVSRDVLSECGCPVTIVKTPQPTNTESSVSKQPLPMI